MSKKKHEVKDYGWKKDTHKSNRKRKPQPPIKIYRQSGLPVYHSDAIQWKREWTQHYDQLVEQIGEYCNDNHTTFKSELEKKELELNEKYPKSASLVDFDQIPKMIAKCNAPILLQIEENKEVVGYVIDIYEESTTVDDNSATDTESDTE